MNKEFPAGQLKVRPEYISNSCYHCLEVSNDLFHYCDVGGGGGGAIFLDHIDDTSYSLFFNEYFLELPFGSL